MPKKFIWGLFVAFAIRNLPLPQPMSTSSGPALENILSAGIGLSQSVGVKRISKT